VTLGDEAANLLDESSNGIGVLGVALNEQIVSLRPDADVEKAFEVSQVVVVGPEERGEAVLADGDTACGSSSDRDISLCYKELTDRLSVPFGARVVKAAPLRQAPGSGL
jgi:hypothetical protein